MYLKRIFAALIVAIAAMTVNVNAQSSEAAAGSKEAPAAAVPSDILGTWEVTTTFSDGFKSKSLLTFAPGATSSTGSLFSTSDIDFTAPVPCANQQGVWSNSDGLNFDLTFKGFCYNAQDFSPFGTVKIRGRITLGSLGKGFSGKVFVVLMRNDGTVEFSDNATVRAVRMAVEPLP